jgi:lysyl-tRNA synthetase class 2
MRNFFDAHGFVEVETPMLHPIPGGAAARPFVTHHNALDIDLYLRIAPELYLKRLVVGGIERVYEINRNFRNEGISTRHNPEFTMVEFYIAHHDYHYMMDFVETMLRTIVAQVCEVECVPFGERIVDFEKPFVRMSMQEAVAHHVGMSIAQIQDEAHLDMIVRLQGIMLDNKKVGWGEKLYALFEHVVEPTLQNPTFITGFPLSVSPLSKKSVDNPLLTDRFELFVAGMELANGFNELNDPDDQAERFKDQVQARESGDIEAHHYDADYIKALEYALPPTVGAGIGIDRLAMLLTNTTSIKDVILFPTLKPERD